MATKVPLNEMINTKKNPNRKIFEIEIFYLV